MSLGHSEILELIFKLADRSPTDESSLLYINFSEALSQPSESTPEVSAVQVESSGTAEVSDMETDIERDKESDIARVEYSGGSGAISC